MSTGTLPPTVALVVKLVAKPDQVDEVSTFLTDAVRLANQEQGTIAWFALRTTRPRSGSSMPFRPRVNARSTWRARSPRACCPMQNGSWTSYQRSCLPRSSPPSCPNDRGQPF